MYYLARGEPGEAARFTALPADPPPELDVDSAALEQGWRGWLLLAGGDAERGVATMDSAIQRIGFADANYLGVPWGRYAIAIARMPERRAQAIRILRQQTTTVITNVGEHYLALAQALEAEGDRAAARDAYAHVLRLWANAAEFRKPALDEARRALERLAVEPR
jgi:predicted Zn-dependent protease